MNFIYRAVITVLMVAILVPAASAQNYPMPARAGQPAVLCTGCPGQNYAGQSNDGLPTAQYGPPLLKHVGRLVDSQRTVGIQHIGFRTARAGQVRVAYDRRGTAPPRAYIGIGEAVGAYSLDRFFSAALPGGMVGVDQIVTGARVAGRQPNPYEQITMFDGFFYPEAKQAGWTCEFSDSQQRLFDFDFDDRGYVYMAYMIFGWGIAADRGETDATHMGSVSQVHGTDLKSVSDVRMIAALKSGSQYYAVIGNPALKDRHELWDVTNPGNPVHRQTRQGSSKYGIQVWAKDEARRRFAYVAADNILRIVDYDTFIGGGAGDEYAPESGKEFSSLAFDENGVLWVTERTPKISAALNLALWRFTPSGSSYAVSKFNKYGSEKFSPSLVHARAGYVAVAGAGNGIEARVFKVEGGDLRLLDGSDFFRRYYHRADSGYAQPNGYTGLIAGLQVVDYGGKTYLIYNAFGLGDVFELEGGDSVSVARTATRGTPNPYAASTATGPFYGDILEFKATSSNPAVQYDVNWNFGNSESSSNTGSNQTGQAITHQYTGLTTAAKIATPKTVTATAIVNASISGSASVTLAVPTPRIGLASTGSVLPATGTLDVVAGDQFTDASDGTVESHFATWTIDGAASNAAPNQKVSVGAVGPHTLQFSASYGAYNASTFALTSPYVTSLAARTYTVRPFVVSLNPAARQGTDFNFTGTVSRTADTSILSATEWTVTWTALAPGSATPVATSTQLVAVGTVPTFSVAKDLLPNNSVVTLQVAVDPLKVSSPTYATHSDEMTLSIPDPVIQITGCAYANQPCTLTATSASTASTAGWNLSWVVKRGSTTVRTGTSNPLSVSLTEAGTYTATLTETLFDVTVSKSFPVEATQCGPAPGEHQVAIGASCSTCTAGQSVSFSASLFGYVAQECDVFTWSFGDGSASKRGISVTHTFSAGGTFPVKLTVSNPTSPTGTTITKNITVSGGTTTPPPCSAPSNITISYGGSGCTGGSCKAGQSVQFVARRGSTSLASCDSVSWNFGDSTSSSLKSPTKTYNSAGAYTVTAFVSNESGSATGTTAITIVPNDSPTGCEVPPTVVDVVLDYRGRVSGCGPGNGVKCEPNETIDFEAVPYGQFQFRSCDKFEWTFGDGSAKPTTRTASHVFPTSSSSYNVTLRVYNNAGSASFSKTVTFKESAPAKPVPTLSFATFPAGGSKGVPVTFTVQSTIPGTTGWAWDFGDGTKDNSQALVVSATNTVTHTFTNAGKFNVSVRARNAEDVATAPVGMVARDLTIDDIPTHTYLLPVVIHGPGQNNSSWRTDVQVYNPNPNVSVDNPLRLTANFHGIQTQLEVSQSTFIYEDFMTKLTPGASYGPVIVTATGHHAPQIWTRTYNVTDAGTFGQFIPAIRLDDTVSAQVTGEGNYYLAGLRHNGSYRTNLGFLNPNAQAIEATATVRDDTGLWLGTFTVTLQPLQFEQFAVNHERGIPTLDTDSPFSVTIEIPAGKWLVAYASLIDGGSNDPVFMEAVRGSEVSSDDFRNIVVPGVGHLGNWRSDVSIFNPNGNQVSVNLAYHDESGARVAEVPNVQIDGGEFLQYDDIIKQGVFGSLADSSGMLRVTVPAELPADRLPIAFARTYHNDGSGKTYGQGIRGFAAARANVKPGKPALIAGVREVADAAAESGFKYYTNVGAANISDATVTVTFTMLDAVTGAAGRQQEYTLAPGQSIVPRFELGGAEYASLRVEVTGGDVWAFASIIDGRTKDPEYVAAVPLAP